MSAGAERQIGPYIVEHTLAVGGMGELLLARAEGPEGFIKRVVLKRLLPERRREADFVKMFLDEARLVARFTHPNLVHAFELSEPDGVYTLAMEYIEGFSLQVVIERCLARGTPIPEPLAAYMVALAAEGLHDAHELSDESGLPLQVIHRDISPTNVIATKAGSIKVVDFGIAKNVLSEHVTKVGFLKGTYRYVSPEQARTEPLDRRTDIFSLGIVLYELLTLERCFDGENPVACLERIVAGDFIPVGSLRAGLSAPLAAIVNRMLALNPDDRFGTAHEVAEVLQELYPDPTPAQLKAFVAEIAPPPAPAVPDGVDAQPTVPDVAIPSKVVTVLSPRPRLRDEAELRKAKRTTQKLRREELEEAAPPRRRLFALVIVAIVAGLAAGLVGLLRSGGDPTRLEIVTVPPGATVTLNGERLAGVTPLKTTPLAAGDTARLSIHKARFEPVETSVEVVASPNGVHTVQLRLLPRGHGRLSLDATPKVIAFVDGNRVGPTPLDVSLPAGPHAVRLQKKTLGLNKILPVELAAGETTTEQVTFGKGTVAISAPPGITVSLYGKKLGTTPFDPIEIYEGTHTLTFTSPGRPSKRVTIAVEPGKTINVAVKK